ncbi:MAG: DNA polymerase III subunit epsilon [Gammaproteobacteria bacterium]|nr:DNA polymerase III subunit epsilon [Gammaproteobacteria bacterium]
MRQIVLDTETTGLSTSHGHRIIEIGCVELVNRRLTGREFHRFLNPDREIDTGAEAVHGISRSDLETAPRFPEIVEDLLDFLKGAELVIHNAEFDVGFIEHELQLMRHAQPKVTHHATVLDTLKVARQMHPGQRNSLDALCKRYAVDASKRDVHGALIDAELLARVYLAMTGGQTALSLDADIEQAARSVQASVGAQRDGDLNLAVIKANQDEVAAHEAMLETIRKSGTCVWDRPLADR